MSYPFTPPTAESIRIESRLRPEQVDISFPDVAALMADIQARIPGACDVVMMKLRKCAAPYSWPLPNDLVEFALSGEDTSDLDDVVFEQLSLASQAVSKRVLSGLYFSAGQLKEAYKANGIRLREESDALIDTICSTVQFIKNAQPDALAENEPSRPPRSVVRKTIVQI